MNWDVLKSITVWECLVLLLLLPVAMFPSGPQAVLLLFVPFFWLLHLLSGERLFPSTPFNLGLLVMVIMLALSFTVTFDYSISLTKIVGIMYGIALLMASVRLTRLSRSSIWWIVAFMFLIGFGMALLGLIGVTWLDPFAPLNGVKASIPESLQSIPGTVGGVINENELAGTLVWIAPLFIACLIGLPRAVQKYGRLLFVVLALGTLLICGIIIATQSRAGVLALMLGAALIITLYVPRQWRVVVLVTALVVTGVWYFSYGNALEAAAPGAESLQLTGRLEIWSRALDAIRDFPLTGVGVNGFRAVIQVLYPTFLVNPSLDLGHAHNHLLQAALDLGLPGLVSYLSIWFVSAGMVARTLRRVLHLKGDQQPIYALTVGLAGSLLAGWTFGLVDAVSLGAKPGFVWWLLMALAAGTHYLVMYQAESASRRRRHKREVQAVSVPQITAPANPTPESSPQQVVPEERPRSRPRMRYRPSAEDT